ncbi:MAG: hypothetical protein M3Y56_08835 [Armatimonadota bacterium]|nr:hypothetical protein [Armatimonadota bacterium]
MKRIDKHKLDPTRRNLAAALALVMSLALVPAARAGTLTGSYTDPNYLLKLPFGTYSHWVQPWRAYLETVPASTFLNGTGVNLNTNVNPDLLMQMLASHGIHRARIEIGWGNVNYDDETKLNNADTLRAALTAALKHGIRPLILLNSHQGAPCPVQFFNRTLAADAHKGDTTVQLTDTGGLKIGLSGLSQLTTYWAAEALVAKIDGKTVTLSKPLPKDIKAGTEVPMATLKYRPFSPPDTADYRDTVAGWQRYADNVARFVSGVLGTTGKPDEGFDMEIWNELTFGTEFLYINHYYAAAPYKYDETKIFGNLVTATTTYVDAHPDDFRGVLFGDGFANTIPWPASSNEPVRISAIDKHPYAGRKTFPKDQPENGINAVDALLAVDHTGWVPAYTEVFPEYFACGIQTETMTRNLAPFTNTLYNTKIGRNDRVVDGVVKPVSVWITEVNEGPVEDDPKVTTERALALKAKSTARYFCFYLNKGVTQMELYGADGGDKDLGIVQDNFLDFLKKGATAYPADDRMYTSPALAVTGRIAEQMRQGLNPELTVTRPLEVLSVSDTHDHAQFIGDGTAAHPTLYDRDVLAILPFQSNNNRFVIPYYVMTRDFTKDLAPEKFQVKLRGIRAGDAVISCYDPIHDRAVPVTVRGRNGTTLDLELTAVDYPYLLTLSEPGR